MEANEKLQGGKQAGTDSSDAPSTVVQKNTINFLELMGKDPALGKAQAGRTESHLVVGTGPLTPCWGGGHRSTLGGVLNLT